MTPQCARAFTCYIDFSGRACVCQIGNSRLLYNRGRKYSAVGFSPGPAAARFITHSRLLNGTDGPAMWERIAEYLALLCLLVLWAKYYHNYPAKK